MSGPRASGTRHPESRYQRCSPAGGAPARAGAPKRASDVFFDGDVDEVAPFGPGAVVVLDVVVAEEFVQDEPGVGGALADAAVGDDRFVGQHALVGVQGA